MNSQAASAVKIIPGAKYFKKTVDILAKKCHIGML
jgi:hypothetical protein